MPTYVYGCDTCGHRFEKFQKFSDAPLTECPECGAKLRKIIQPAGIVFKGSGWYYTDSRSGSGAGAGNGEGGEPAAAEASTPASNKGDEPAKPATKTATKAESKAPAPAAE